MACPAFKWGRQFNCPVEIAGYRPGDFRIKTNAPDPGLVIRKTGAWEPSLAAPNQLVGVFDQIRVTDRSGNIPLAAWAPDRNWGGSQYMAVCHRVGREMPRFDKARANDFLAYSKAVIRNYFDPIDELTSESTESWLHGASYSGSRKLDLATLRASISNVYFSDKKSKCFIKDEVYPEPKHPRGIMSYTDESKSVVGAIIAACDHAMFRGRHTKRWFVKGSDPKGWPTLLEHLFGDAKVMETDFSSFEAHQRLFYSELVHYWVMHMIRDTCSHGVKRLISNMIKGMNVLEFKALTAYIETRLMSGAMWTSSSNGMLNFMILSYLAMRTKFPNMNPIELASRVSTDFVGVFEGDDGLTLAAKIDERIITDLGLVLKFSYADTYHDAHFCGITCPRPDPTFETSIITDPIEVLRKFFFLPIKYKCSHRRRAQLLRAKAMSYMYLYRHVPIIGELCHKVCEMTREFCSGYQTAVLSETRSWYRSYVERGDAIYQEENRTPPNTREMLEDHPMRQCVWRHFGISPDEQIRIEREIMVSSGSSIVINIDAYVTDLDIEHRKFHLPAPTPLQTSGLYTGNIDVLPVRDDPLALRKQKATMRKVRQEALDFGHVSVGPDFSAYNFLISLGKDIPSPRTVRDVRSSGSRPGV
jgi:hypothetical protein